VTRYVTTTAVLTGLLCVTLTVVTGCDKARALARASVVDPDDASGTGPTAAEPIEVSANPHILFEVFGEREDPRMVPVAVLDGKQLRNIQLPPAGWRQFDRVFHREGATYTLYQDGRATGDVTVKQRMWAHPDAPLYSLPNCRNLVPLSSVALDGKMTTGITVEFLASNAQLSAAAPGVMLPSRVVVRLARQVGSVAAKGAGVPASRLDSLDFRAVAINTGATPEPTIVASFIDPNAEEAAARGDVTSGTFVIADKTGTEYVPTFTHIVSGPASRAEYRRYVDHIDFDGDGVDEIVLEAWRYGGDSYLVVLKYTQGGWHEIFRASPTWCLDPTS
jgi:hypothetical protein